jgi:hypothetical protein
MVRRHGQIRARASPNHILATRIVHGDLLPGLYQQAAPGVVPLAGVVPVTYMRLNATDLLILQRWIMVLVSFWLEPAPLQRTIQRAVVDGFAQVL